MADKNPSDIGTEGLVIFHRDPSDAEGKYYVIPESMWKREENVIKKDDVGRARTLVERGAIFAYIPSGDIPVGAYCYLLNLASLRPLDASNQGGPSGPSPSGDPQEGRPAPGQPGHRDGRR